MGQLIFPVLPGEALLGWTWFSKCSISHAGPTLTGPSILQSPWRGDLVTEGEPGLCRLPCSLSHLFCKTETGFPEREPLVTLPFSVTSCGSSGWLQPWPG